MLKDFVYHTPLVTPLFFSVLESLPNKSFEKFGKTFLDQDGDDDGYHDSDEVAPTVREKENTNVIGQ